MTDGVRYDTGPEGLFYHALVTHVREADKAGNIVTYRQEPDGTLIKTGVIEKVDPQVCGLLCVVCGVCEGRFLAFLWGYACSGRRRPSESAASGRRWQISA